MRDIFSDYHPFINLVYFLAVIAFSMFFMHPVFLALSCIDVYKRQAQFQPRAMKDRPEVVPDGSTNFAMVGQFVEIPEDMVFTEEYSVRAARIAVYTLLDVDKKICPVTPYKKDPIILAKALRTAYR